MFAYRSLPLGFCWVLLIAGMGHAQAADPNHKKIATDLTTYAKAKWPDQTIEAVEKKTGCEKTEVDAGKGKKLKACLIKSDILASRGYRLFVYRESFLTYVGNKLHSVELGEVEKAWRKGGVPAPTQESAAGLLVKAAAEKLQGQDIQLQILDIGKPRLFGETFRMTYLVSLAYQKDGKPEKQERVFVTLESDGTDWQPAPELTF